MKREIIIVREGFVRSIIADTYTFGCLIGGFWLNHNHLGGSTVLNMVLGICFFVIVGSRGGKRIKKFTSTDDAVAYLQGQERDGG